MTLTQDLLVRPSAAASVQRVVAAAQAHLRGEQVPALYLAGGTSRQAMVTMGAAAREVRLDGGGERLLVCTGADFVGLWRDTLRRGLTPFIRRALDARRAILVAGLEAVRDEPVAQGELARLVTPERLVILAGCSHLRHLVAGSPTLAMPLAGAASLCLHEGPCVSDGEAWALIDRVAGYYALSRAALLSRRRTAQIALARQVAMYVLRAAGLTYDRVGQLLGRDHATVLHGCRRIQQISMRDRLVRHDLAALCPAVPAA